MLWKIDGERESWHWLMEIPKVEVSCHTLLTPSTPLLQGWLPRDYRQDPVLMYREEDRERVSSGDGERDEGIGRAKDKLLYVPELVERQREFHEKHLLSAKENKELYDQTLSLSPSLYRALSRSSSSSSLSHRLGRLSHTLFGVNVVSLLTSSKKERELQSKREFCRELQMLPLFIQHPDTMPVDPNGKQKKNHDLSYAILDSKRKTEGPER
jgi:hypothetical protein